MQTNRISDIEALRGFAVFYVICLHIPAFIFIMPEYFRHGWSGVDLFFVISGFVVTRAFRRDADKLNGSAKVLGRFYLKRAFRILPALVACVLFWIWGWAFFNKSGAFGHYTGAEVLRQVQAIFLFYANYVKGFYLYEIHIFPIWSLNVEEHFYFLFPLLAFFVKNPRVRVGILAAVVIGIAAIYRPLTTNRLWTYLSYASDMRFDQLAAGVILAEVSMAKHDKLRAWFDRLKRPNFHRMGSVFAYALALSIWTMPWLFRNDQMAGLKLGMIISMVLSVAVVFLASGNLDLFSLRNRVLERVLNYFGARSYGLYLFHMPAYWVANEIIQRSPLLQGWNVQLYGTLKDAVYYSIVLLVLVEVVYQLVEKPFLRLSARLTGAQLAPESPVSTNAPKRSA